MPDFTWEEAKAWAEKYPDQVDAEKLKKLFPKEAEQFVKRVHQYERVDLSLPEVKPDVTAFPHIAPKVEEPTIPATIESQTELLQPVSEIERRRISRQRSGRKFFDTVSQWPRGLTDILDAVPQLAGLTVSEFLRNIARASGGDEEKFANEPITIAGREYPSLGQFAQQTVRELPKTFLGGIIDVPFGETTLGDVAYNITENPAQAFLDATVARLGITGTTKILARPFAKMHLESGLNAMARGALTDVGNILPESATARTLYRHQLLAEQQFGQMTPSEIITRAGEQINKANLWQRYFADPAWRLSGEVLVKISPEPLKRLFLTQYGVDPDYLALSRSIQAQIGVNVSEGVDWASATRPLTTEFERNAMLNAITDPARGTRSGFSIQKLLGEPRKYAQHIADRMTSLGKQAKQVGILGDESFDFFTGRYLPKLNEEGFTGWWNRLAFKNQFSGRMKHRGPEREISLSELSKWEDRGWEWFKDISSNKVVIRKFTPYGDVRDPFTLYAKGVADLEHDIGLGRMLNAIADNPAWTKSVPTDGYIRVGSSKFNLREPFNKIEKLQGKYVQRDIARDIKSLVADMPVWIRNYNKVLSTWKVFKTAFSPPTHMRNLFSNIVLADMGGLSAWRRPDIFKEALSDLRTQGKWYKEAQAGGLLGREFYKAEVEQMWRAGDKVGREGFFSAIADNRYISAPAKLYQAEEQWFKLAKYIHNRQKGLSIVESVNDAHKWLFDYVNVAPFVNFMRKTTHPFFTFTAKAAPRIAESWFKHPVRMTKYYLVHKYFEDYAKAKLGITDEEYTLIKKNLPEYMRNGAWVLLPERDRNDNLQFFNETYFLPWGDIVATTDDVPVIGTGYIADLLVPTNPLVAPFYEIAFNKTVFGRREIWKADESAFAKSLEHVAATWTPPIMPGVGYVAKGIHRDLILNKPNYFGERANRLQGLGSIFGVRTKGIKPEREAHFNALEIKNEIKKLKSRLISLETKFKNGAISRPERDIRKLNIQLKIDDLIRKYNTDVKPLSSKYKGE